VTGSRRTHGQDGAALVIGLVVLTSFGLIIGSLMSLGGSSLLATSALRDQRTRIYAAEAAIDEEVTGLRAGSPCTNDSPFSAPPYALPKANPVLIIVRNEPGPERTCALSAYDGTRLVLQATFAIDQTGTATVLSWDTSHESTTTTVPPTTTTAVPRTTTTTEEP
jgi:Tfp pilus assembly protein PilX